MFCHNCGNQCKDGDLFCCNCGTKLQAPTPAPTPAPAPAPQAAPAQAPVYKLYMDAKGLTMFNYKFEIKDEAGNVRYKAATVTESMIRYNAKLYGANDEELIKVSQQAKMTFAAMNFDFLTPNGEVITDAIQKVGMVNYTYTLGRFGITLKGNFMSLSFDFMCGDTVVAHIQKKAFSWGDSYELTYSDPNMEQVFLASVLMIQMVIAAQRNRRRR